MKNPLALVAALLTVATLTAPTDASACLHRMPDARRNVAGPNTIIVYHENSGNLANLDGVTRDLNEGRNRDVIERLYEMEGFALNGWAFNIASATAYQREVVYIAALATIRSDGKWVRIARTEPAGERLRQGNIAWATRALEELAFVGEAAERHLAEAWARDPATADFAIRKFEELAAAGELFSPFQYEELARLYEDRGELVKARRARDKKERIEKA